MPGQTDKSGTANPQSLNRYSYVNNNPLTSNDPSGQCQSNPEDMSGEGAEACAEAIGEAVGGEGGKPPECYRCNTSEYDTPGARVECYTGGECGSPMDAPNQSAAAQARAEEAGEAGPAETNPSGARFEVTESGVAIPTDPEELHQNLSQLQDTSTNPESSRKFVGRDSQGPVRIRVEKGHPEDPDFNGKPDPLHVVDHLHIDRRKNVETGSWNSREKVSYGWPF